MLEHLTRIQRNRSGEVSKRRLQPLLRRIVPSKLALQVLLERFATDLWRGAKTSPFTWRDRDFDRVSNSLRHLALNLQYIAEITAVLFGPDGTVAGDSDKLKIDADASA